MKIAVIGAGFSGLAVTWNLLKKYSDCQIDLWDRQGIGGGASGIAAGLLHPYAGLHAKLNRFAMEGLRETEILLKIASAFVEKDVFRKKPILRVAANSSMASDYLNASEKNADIEWLATVKPFLPHVSYPGIMIQQAFTIDCPLYLKGLWEACKQFQVNLIQQSFKTPESLASYDLAIFATGAYNLFPEIKINQIKGQILEIQDPELSLPFPINSQGYFLKNLNNPHFTAGATFERNFDNDKPNIELAKNEILAKIKEIIPSIANEKIIDCRAGLRASTKDHLPLIQQISARIWTITGMGSKGLLYHALYAKQLVERINLC